MSVNKISPIINRVRINEVTLDTVASAIVIILGIIIIVLLIMRAAEYLKKDK